MFDEWAGPSEPAYQTLFEVDRTVYVDMRAVYPSLGGLRWHELPLWVKTQGLWLEATMVAHQTAWLRRADGGWLSHVLVKAGSANYRSRLTMSMWLEPNAIRLDPPGQGTPQRSAPDTRNSGIILSAALSIHEI